jgi:hypothetical protein
MAWQYHNAIALQCTQYHQGAAGTKKEEVTQVGAYNFWKIVFMSIDPINFTHLDTHLRQIHSFFFYHAEKTPKNENAIKGLRETTLAIILAKMVLFLLFA